MIDGNAVVQGAAALSIFMAGIGALKLMLTAAESVKRIPNALERGAEAVERIAEAATISANLAQTLMELREGQEEIRIGMSTLARRQEDSSQALEEIQKRLTPHEGPGN